MRKIQGFRGLLAVPRKGDDGVYSNLLRFLYAIVLINPFPDVIAPYILASDIVCIDRIGIKRIVKDHDLRSFVREFPVVDIIQFI